MQKGAHVLIVGAGPTGLAAALFLAERGIKARIVEKLTEPSGFSKALAVNPRTLSLLQSSGVTQRFLANGWKMQAFNLWSNGRHVVRADFSKAPHQYPFMLIQSQTESEEIMATSVEEYGVCVERNIELTGVEVTKEGVIAELSYRNNRTETMQADYLLGADGSHSTVRSALDIDFRGAAYEDSFRLYDIELDLPLPGQEVHAFLHDDGALFMIRIKNNIWRIIGNISNLLEQLPAGSKAGSIVWKSDFGFSHRRAAHFMKGRAFLAGDAAHIHSAIGGRGMNLGIEDAFVFATLLAKDKLQDYERLRQPVVASVMGQIHRMTEVMRGKTFSARAVRLLTPLLPLLFPLVAGSMRKFVLGLDHEVKV